MNPNEPRPEVDTTPEPATPEQSYDSPSDSTPAPSSDAPTPEQSPISSPLVQPTPVPEPAETPVAVTQKPKVRKGFIVLLIFVVLIAAGAASYFIWQAMQPVPAVETQTTAGEESTDTTVDSSAEVAGEAAAIEEDLDSLDSSEFEDSTLDNQTLSE